jgi:predicted double-glycine peptidase
MPNPNKQQCRSYTCGPASIANAIRQLGKNIFEDDVVDAIKKFHKNWEIRKGTDAPDMRRAIRHFGYKPIWRKWFRYEDFREAMKWLRENLRNNIPVILSVDNNEHWVCALAETRDRIVINDPNVTSRTFSFLGLSRLKQRWWCVYNKGKSQEYFGITVVPKGKKAKELWKNSVPLNKEVLSRMARKGENDMYRLADDLREIFGRGMKRSNGISAALWLQRNRNLFFRAIDEWWQEVSRAKLKQDFDDFLAVANAIGLEFNLFKEKVALVKFTALLSAHYYERHIYNGN